MTMIYGAIPTPQKYKYPLMTPVRYKNGMQLRQTSDNVFVLFSMPQSIAQQNIAYLKSRLMQYSPVDTGYLRRNYDVYKLEVRPGKWGLVMYNRASYFKFPFNYYKKKRRNFIRRATDDVIQRIG